jgi:hypothetical protein
MGETRKLAAILVADVVGYSRSGAALAAENIETKTPRRCGPTRGLGRAPRWRGDGAPVQIKTR